MITKFRVVVLQEFLAYAEKSSVIDMGTLRGIADSFTDEHPGDEDLVIDLSPPVVKKRGRKKKTVEESCDFCRMPEINEDKCMARTFAKGLGTQCSRKHSDCTEYCKLHSKEEYPIFGRIDAPRALKKHGTDMKCGWRNFMDGGNGVEVPPVEEVAEAPVEAEAPVVLEAEAPVVMEAPAIDEQEQEEEPVVEVEEVAELVAEAQVEEVEAEAPVVMEAPAIDEQEQEEEPVVEVEEVAELVAEAQVEEVEEEVEEVAEPIVETLVEEVEERVEEVPAPVMVVVEDCEGDDLALSDEEGAEEALEEKTGAYQGVTYRFEPSGDGEYSVKFLNQKTMKWKLVGKLTGDEDMVFDDEWQDIHDTKALIDDNEDIVWD